MKEFMFIFVLLFAGLDTDFKVERTVEITKTHLLQSQIHDFNEGIIDLTEYVRNEKD